MAQEAADALASYGFPKLVGCSPTRIRQWFDCASAATGIKLYPHLMRHTFATRLMERGADVRTLQELMNHQDLSQIPRYTAVTDPRKRSAVLLLDT